MSSKYGFIIILCLMILSHQTRAQKLQDFGVTPNQSHQSTLNVNHARGVDLQDIKRSTFLIVVRNPGGTLFIGSGTLVNTALNSHDQSGQKTYHILTAAHIIQGQPAKGLQWHFTPDYELPMATDRGREDQTNHFPCTVADTEIILRDTEADILLLKVSPGNTDVFKYSYAAGWDLSYLRPDHNISHPQKDIKKIYSLPEYISLVDNYSINVNGENVVMRPESKFWSIESWNRFDDRSFPINPEPASSGSALLNIDKKVTGVATAIGPARSNFSMIGNSWHIDDNRGLISSLDPLENWINKVPGGYVDGLNPAPSGELNLEIETNDTEKDFDYEFHVSEVFDLGGTFRPLEKEGGLFLIENSGSDRVYLLITKPVTRSNGNLDNYLVYGAFAQGSGQFESNSFTISPVPNGLDYNLRGRFRPDPDGKSTDFIQFKAKLVDALVEERQAEGGIESLFREITPLKIKLVNPSGNQVSIKAINIPGYLPMNAREFFNEDGFDISNILTSDKYPTSSGNSSTLHISNFSIRQNSQTLKSITTGNNGGYLNLINPNYSIGDIITTYRNEETNKIDITIDVEGVNATSFYYKVWLDYEEDYSYESVMGTVSELIAEGIGSNGSVTETYIVPNYSDLGMAPGGAMTRRIRVSVSAQNDVTPGGTYAHGEVEDYLVEIVVPTCEELKPEEYETYAEAELPYCGEGCYRQTKESLADIYQESIPGSLTFNIQTVHGLQYAKTKTPETYTLVDRNFVDNKHESVDGNLVESDLLMDVYYPVRTDQAGTYQSPLIIYIFGGGFVGGERNNRLAIKTCEWLAKRGYVVAAIDYRLGMDAQGDAELSKRAVLRAWQDSRAAVQYWRGRPESTSPEGTQWRIDPEKVYVLGHSAGGITALHNVYLSQTQFESELDLSTGFLRSANPDYNVTYTQETGPNVVAKAYDLTETVNTTTVCLDATCSTPLSTGTDGQANKAVSFAGALGKKEWATGGIRAMDIHHFSDETVSYQSYTPFGWIAQLAGWAGVLALPSMDGGFSIGQYLDPSFTPATQSGGDTRQVKDSYVLQSLSQSDQGGMGNSIVVPYHYPQLAFGTDISIVGENTVRTQVEPRVMYLVDAFFTKEGSNPPNVSRPATDTAETEVAEEIDQQKKAPVFSVFPNPASDQLSIIVDIGQAGPLSLELIDMQGRKIEERQFDWVSEGMQWIRLDHLDLPSGMYVLNFRCGELVKQERLLIR